jgi:hypothetical protein
MRRKLLINSGKALASAETREQKRQFAGIDGMIVVGNDDVTFL